MQGFNHHMLCLARDACGLTQSEMARKMGVGQGTYSKYETGILAPPEPVIDQIVTVLGKFPSTFFAENERPYGFPPFHFRKRKKLTVKALNRIVAEMNIRRMHVKKMLTSYKMPTTGVIPEIDPDEYAGVSKRRPTMEELAQHLRGLWGVPRGPIENMVDLIERNGGIVIPCDFGSDLIDAMSQRIDGMPVLFFINPSAPADRIRHTLAHELGHMLLHTLSLSKDDDMEDQADAFAGAFLVPADEIRPHLRVLDLRQLANMKGYWKVSIASLAMRADRLGLITEYQKRKFWMEMGPHRKVEPNEPPKEPAKALQSMIAFHRNNLGYSKEEMASLLALLPAEYERMYGPEIARPRPSIRLVK